MELFFVFSKAFLCISLPDLTPLLPIFFFLYYGYFYNKSGLYSLFSTNWHLFVHNCENRSL